MIKDIKERKAFDFELVNNRQFLIKGSFKGNDEKVKAFFYSFNGSFSNTLKGWLFPLQQMNEILLKGKVLFKDFSFNEIPQFVFEALRPIDLILNVSNDFALVYEGKDDKVLKKNDFLHKSL